MQRRTPTIAMCMLGALVLLSACTSVKNTRGGNAEARDAANDGGPQTPDAAPGEEPQGGSGAGGTGGRQNGQISTAGRGAAGSGGAGAAAPSGGAGSAAGTGGQDNPSKEPPAQVAGAGAPAPMTGEVSGKVVDFWLQGMEAVQVTIGSTTLFTDNQGKFRISDVPATYDATMVINTTQNGQPMRFVWRYEGLTRRDPTLQADQGRTPRGAWLDVRVSGVNFMNRREGDIVLSSYGGVTGEHLAEKSTAAQERIRIVWEGPQVTRFTGHAFRMLKLADRIEPNDYWAYDSVTFEITAENEVTVEYDLPQGLLPSGVVTGSVDGIAGTDRRMNMYMRFPDNAVIPLLEDPGVGPTFSYGIPSMPADAKIVLVASQTSDGMQYAHVDNIDKDSGPVALSMLASPRLIAPAEGAVVDATTLFQWSAEPNVYVLWAWDESGRDAVHVVTTKREARLPQAETYVYQPNHKFVWDIETHGNYASVDAAAGPEGFLDTITTLYRHPSGPVRGKGTLLVSRLQRVTIKP